ncbi:hypothetical protein H0264_22680 [Nocardia huaxiensis]|uniref:Uncharacterized protein n=1 Tax=Nocardia huaxiensis TaxID=2755382 RepID=A0A7D6V6Y9_9NOCA|nr:hypothetical protein [Nocardia huaxiensis]QLY28194.1 hypothetical protein H0264_22680 [Nocardia huaxiensis]
MTNTMAPGFRHEDQIRELAGLGIAASVFSRHIYVWGDRHREIFLGPERAARLHQRGRRGSDLSGIRCEQTWVGGVRRWQSG